MSEVSELEHGLSAAVDRDRDGSEGWVGWGVTAPNAIRKRMQVAKLRSMVAEEEIPTKESGL